ncbi:hypothetical protein EYF80_035523 [Liparis tanakae]|uniref:Uncharacterized protein n=1 Tax=Liparis tanakae TaxID=230148 RepID=A0A4Z2GM57_9TELE|nr:hypothetical protein EYF80_035523 [Liparis tanakae]
MAQALTEGPWGSEASIACCGQSRRRAVVPASDCLSIVRRTSRLASRFVRRCVFLRGEWLYSPPLTDPFPDEKNGRPHGTPTRQNSRRSEGGGDRCEWGDRADGGSIGGSGGVLQRRGSAKERTRLLSSNGTQSQP